MAMFVSVLGVVIVLIGFAAILRPQVLQVPLGSWNGPGRFWAAIVIRVVLGALFLWIAPSCRLPVVVSVVGWFAIAAAIALLFVGQRRLDAFIDWWLARQGLVRLAGLFAVLFGALLMYAGK